MFTLKNAFTRVNPFGFVLWNFTSMLVPLTVESLIRAARRYTGLEDPGDPFFIVPFRILLRSFIQESHLNGRGRIGLRREFLRLLSNRLLIQNVLKKIPAIYDIRIESPLFIVSLPRTGTTYLHNLLAQDPRTRAPLMWELFHPAPLPGEKLGDQRRLKIAKARTDKIRRICPAITDVHPMSPTAPDECFHLFKNAFMTPAFSLKGKVPSYMSWLYSHDMRVAYKYYQDQLKLLSWKHTKKLWALKSPSHLPFLDALLEVFPDATLLQIHRSPLDIIPSYCRLLEISRAMSSDHVDSLELGSEAMSLIKVSLDRSMKVREMAPKHFLDVSYHELLVNPAAAVSRIFQHLRWEPSLKPANALSSSPIQTKSNFRPKEKRYFLRYGLDPETIKKEFREYIQMFKKYLDYK